jgi:hypothetical protein
MNENEAGGNASLSRLVVWFRQHQESYSHYVCLNLSPRHRQGLVVIVVYAALARKNRISSVRLFPGRAGCYHAACDPTV